MFPIHIREHFGAHPGGQARALGARAHPKPAVQTLARTLAMTGCRVSEALAIRACDVDLEARELRISTLKRRTDHWRAVPVPEDLVHALELVHRLRRLQGSARGANRPLWPITRQTANRQVGAIMRTAGIEGPQACPRGLRHSYGVAAVTAGVPLPTVAAVLGHASLTTTAIYTTAIGAQARELVSRVWG
ncbi:MAG: tyrosine-type recombinase/integrase [Alphaproteobacteria bacterium]|nr:tyrosine-type recombinase/integrase [Alphaproteobacteria bacterium]